MVAIWLFAFAVHTPVLVSHSSPLSLSSLPETMTDLLPLCSQILPESHLCELR